MTIQDDLSGVLVEATDAIKALQASIADTSSYVRTLEDQIASLKHDIVGLQYHIVDQEKEIAEKTPLVVDPTTVSSVSDAVTTLAKAIAGMNNTIVSEGSPSALATVPPPAPEHPPTITANAGYVTPEPELPPGNDSAISFSSSPVPAGTLPSSMRVVEVEPGVFPLVQKRDSVPTIAGKLAPGTLVATIK